MQYCTKCGNVIEEGEEYCPRCGQRVKTKRSQQLETPEPRQVPTTTTEETKPTRTETSTFGMIIAIIGIVIILLIGIPLLGIILAVVAIMMGAIGNQSNEEQAKGAIAAGVILLILSVATWVMYYYTIMSYFT